MASSDAMMVGYTGLGTSIIGGLTTAIGDIFSGISQQKMYDYQASVAKVNAQIAQQNSAYALQVGDLQAQKYGLQAGQQKAAIKTVQSASGLDVNSGSAKQVQQSEQTVTNINTETLRSNAAKTAYNYQVQAAMDVAQAGVDTVAGQNARSAGMIQATSSLIGTAGSVDSQWLRGAQLGLWSGGSNVAGSSTSGGTVSGGY